MKSKIISVSFVLVLLTAALAVVGLIRESIPSAGAIVLAQNGRTYELSCPAGTSVMPGWETFNASTGKWRQVACIDALGKITLQPDFVGNAIPSLPISLTTGVSGLLPIANGGTGAASFAAASLPTYTGTITAGDLATWNSAGVLKDGGAPATATQGIWQISSGSGFAPASACSFTLDSASCGFAAFPAARTAIRFQYLEITVPAGCTTYAVIGLRDVTSSTTLSSVTLASTDTTGFHSATISVNITAGDTLQLGPITAEAGCSTAAAVGNYTVIYQ